MTAGRPGRSSTLSREGIAECDRLPGVGIGNRVHIRITLSAEHQGTGCLDLSRLSREIPAMIPETRFVESDGVSVAYQVFGDGPVDLVFIHGMFSNLDILWEQPRVARFLLSLGRLARVILFDRRGTGLSDRVTPPTFEVHVDDIRAVMDAAGSRRACMLGYSEGRVSARCSQLSAQNELSH